MKTLAFCSTACLSMALPAQGQSLLGSWHCIEPSGTANVKTTQFEFKADGEERSTIFAIRTLGAITFQADIRTNGTWVLNGSQLGGELTSLQITRLMFGTKDMTSSRSADDLRTLLMREYEDSAGETVTVTFDGPDKIKMADPYLDLICTRVAPAPTS